jgi:hypothetical protein
VLELEEGEGGAGEAGGVRAVAALAARFEQAVAELAACGLISLAKRRKGTFAQRAYLPPEALM